MHNKLLKRRFSWQWCIIVEIAIEFGPNIEPHTYINDCIDYRGLKKNTG